MPSQSSQKASVAIIVAAGSSSRMGFDKLASPLCGKPVLRRTLDAFLTAETIDSIVIVCPKDRWHLLEADDFTKPVIRTDGGENRQDSVSNGLTAISGEPAIIAIHDAARPLVSPADIDRTVQAAITHRAASLARRVTETVKRSDHDGRCLASVDRENLWFMETPQVAQRSLLEQAFQNISTKQLSVTDEVSALEAIGIGSLFIESTSPNLKITTPADLLLAEALWKSKS